MFLFLLIGNEACSKTWNWMPQIQRAGFFGITSACPIPHLPRIIISLLDQAFPFFSRQCRPKSRLRWGVGGGWGGVGNSRRISSQENHTWGINQRWLQRSQITIFFIGNFMFISFSPQTPLSWHWELLLAAVCICLCARSHHVEHSQSVSMHHTGPDLYANWFAFVKICCFPCFKINLGARLGNSFHFILHYCRLKIHKIILHICLRWTDCQQCKQTPPECLCVYIVTFNF